MTSELVGRVLTFTLHTGTEHRNSTEPGPNLYGLIMERR